MLSWASYRGRAVATRRSCRVMVRACRVNVRRPKRLQVLEADDAGWLLQMELMMRAEGWTGSSGERCVQDVRVLVSSAFLHLAIEMCVLFEKPDFFDAPFSGFFFRKPFFLSLEFCSSGREGACCTAQDIQTKTRPDTWRQERWDVLHDPCVTDDTEDKMDGM